MQILVRKLLQRISFKQVCTLKTLMFVRIQVCIFFSQKKITGFIIFGLNYEVGIAQIVHRIYKYPICIELKLLILLKLVAFL